MSKLEKTKTKHGKGPRVSKDKAVFGPDSSPDHGRISGPRTSGGHSPRGGGSSKK